MRALCYRLAVATGLRYSEIASITPESFDWKAPSVAVAAAYTKNGDPATLPLPTTWRTIWPPIVATLTPGTPVFPLPDEKGAEDAPGRPGGRRHPLPRTPRACSSTSIRCGARWRRWPMPPGFRPGSSRSMMRHSTLELTGRYTRPRAVDIEAAAVDASEPQADRGQTRGDGHDGDRSEPRFPLDCYRKCYRPGRRRS